MSYVNEINRKGGINMMLEDTIAGVATAAGEGGIGIIRISGENSKDIISRLFVSIKGKDINTMKSFTMRYGHIVNPEDNTIIDEAIISYMQKPNTYTREDIVEINSHGGPTTLRKILSLVLKSGARLAEPGEFTKRAFLNGRIDLSQAEGVMDLIRAKTDESLRVALEQTEGKVSKKTHYLMDKLLKILAHIEAALDYPEDDIEDATSAQVVEEAKIISWEIIELVKASEAGKIIREGLNTVIIGKPNVGKSSLLNVLIDENKAIVTDIPGTTRDIIEEYINVEGIPVKIIDTAGIRETKDIVEKIGVEKTKEYIEKADLIIFMVDSSRELEDEDEEILKLIADKKAIIVLNKQDLPNNTDMQYLRERVDGKKIISASMNNEVGIDEIKKEIVNMVYSGDISREVCITNVRHINILNETVQNINSGIDTLQARYPLDMASIEFKNAYLKLGEITGDTTQEDIIDRIFSDFCIGK